MQRAGAPNTEKLVGGTLALAARLKLPVVATHPVQFLARDDFKAHEARVCISQGYVLGDQRRPKLFTPEQYFKTQDEMAQLFADLPQALENAVEIARRCNLEIELGKSRLPAFPTPKGVSLDAFLQQRSREGTGAAGSRSSSSGTRKRRATASASRSRSRPSRRWATRATS